MQMKEVKRGKGVESLCVLAAVVPGCFGLSLKWFSNRLSNLIITALTAEALGVARPRFLSSLLTLILSVSLSDTHSISFFPHYQWSAILRFLSLGIIISRFLYVVVCINTLFLCTAEQFPL